MAFFFFYLFIVFFFWFQNQNDFNFMLNIGEYFLQKLVRSLLKLIHTSILLIKCIDRNQNKSVDFEKKNIKTAWKSIEKKIYFLKKNNAINNKWMFYPHFISSIHSENYFKDILLFTSLVEQCYPLSPPKFQQ